MKKAYIKPQTEVFTFLSSRMLATSPGSKPSINEEEGRGDWNAQEKENDDFWSNNFNEPNWE